MAIDLTKRMFSDAKADEMIEAINGVKGSGISSDVKTALLGTLRNVAFKNEDGLLYLNDLEEALDEGGSGESSIPLFTSDTAVSFTGNNSLATGVTFQQDKSYTLLVDCTVTTWPSSGSIPLIFSNQHDSSVTAFLAGQISINNNTNKPTFWGWGISWGAADDLFNRNERIRMAFTCNPNVKYGNAYTYNASTSTTKMFSRTYNTLNTMYQAGEFVFGKTEISSGFIGTLHNARIYGKELSQAKIFQYLKEGVI